MPGRAHAGAADLRNCRSDRLCRSALPRLALPCSQPDDADLPGSLPSSLSSSAAGTDDAARADKGTSCESPDSRTNASLSGTRTARRRAGAGLSVTIWDVPVSRSFSRRPRWGWQLPRARRSLAIDAGREPASAPARLHLYKRRGGWSFLRHRRRGRRGGLMEYRDDSSSP